MMIKSGYQEGLYFEDNLRDVAGELEESIRNLLSENHGVGILGGYFDPNLPFCMVSELTVQMLGYRNSDGFEAATGNTMSGLVCDESYSEAAFSTLSGACELHLRAKNGVLWVRLVKRGFSCGAKKPMWLASVCDMDALYQKELLVNRILNEKRQRELAQQEELRTAYHELERQKAALEQALADARLNNEIISAIGKTYWRLYRLDLPGGTFDEISANGKEHHLTGDYGKTDDRFPAACRNTVAESYVEDMLAFLDTTTLAERLKCRDELSHEYLTKTGNWHVGRFIVQQRDESGLPTKLLYAIRIVNEQKKQELEYERRLAKSVEEAERANLSKTDFLRRMSHDIRTPINGIRGMIEIANHSPNDLNKQKECRDKIWEASGYLLALVNDVLDMNKLESGNILLEEKPFDLSKLLNEANTIAEMQATEHGIHFSGNNEKRHIEHNRIIGSPVHLKQILLNLASNAIKYNRENGNVAVWCKELSFDGKTVLFQFVCKDNGIGMSPAFQKRAFEPFAQEGKSIPRTTYSGTGLGLSIVKALVEKMGGSIYFESAENIGTQFFVNIPFRADTNPSSEAEEAAQENVDFTGTRILLAEDNDLNVEIAHFLLEQYGITVTDAGNGREAVDIFAASAPGTFDVILMDVMMPVMNGLEATQAIRALEREDAASIPIMAMTANAFVDDIKASLEAGMNEHLIKPLEAGKLLAALRKYIHK